MRPLPSWTKGAKAFAVGVAALGAAFVGAAGFGLDLPRPEWHAEHDADVSKVRAKHAFDVAELSAVTKKALQLAAAAACDIVEASRKRIRDDWYANKDRQEPYKVKKKPVPQWLKERARSIEEKQRNNEKKLRAKSCP